jgi:fibronectin-binding autotransporter adhesin
MMLATTTSTYAGAGTIAFGSNPGVFFGSHTFGATGSAIALTGSAGIIAANGTVTFNNTSNLSGLTGAMDIHNATVTLATNDFTGNINIRNGTLNLNASQTAPGLGDIRVGAPENDVDLIGTLPTLSFGGAGANAVINRNIVIDNGFTNVVGESLSFSLMARFSPLSNATGSQTLSGNLTLNTPVNLQGGGGTTGTGATNFTGNVSGPSLFMLANGRAVFDGTISNDGGFTIGGQSGFTAQATFRGTGSGTGGYRLNTGNNNLLRYEAGSLMSGTISTLVYPGLAGLPSLVPLETSTINNPVFLNGAMIIAPAAGITGTLAGPVGGTGTLAKLDAGTIVLTSPLSTHTGEILVDAGTLRINGTMPSSATFVRTGGRLDGTGTLTGAVNIASPGTLAPGNSIGTFTVGNLALAGTLAIELNTASLAADLLEVDGTVTLTSTTAVLDLQMLGTSFASNTTFLIVDNDGVDLVGGTFASITGLSGGLTATVDYAYAGTDALGRIGSGNDIAVSIVVPEPATLAVLAGVGCVVLRRRR